MLNKKTLSNLFSGPETLLPKFLIGLVVDVNTATCTLDARIEGVGVLQGIPILNLYGSKHLQDISWGQNYRASNVLILSMGSDSYVLGTLPSFTNDGTLDKTLSQPVVDGTYGGGNEDTYAKEGTVLKNYQGNRPNDFLPGDKIIQNESGVGLQLLKGGIARLKASQLAQFLLFKYKSLARLVARSFQFFSDFGEFFVGSNSKGDTYMKMSGGADFKTETSPDTKAWTVQAWVGHYDGEEEENTPYTVPPPEYETHPVQNLEDADSRLYLRVNDYTNTTYALFMVDTHGNVLVKTTGDERKSIGNDKTVVANANLGEFTGKDKQVVVGGNETKVVAGDLSVSVTGSYDIAAVESATVGAGRTLTIQSEDEIRIKAPKIYFN